MRRAALIGCLALIVLVGVALVSGSGDERSTPQRTYVDRPSLFGLNTLTHDNDYSRVARDMAEARRLGAEWVRTYPPAVKPDGKLDFDDLDARLAEIRRHGLMPLVALGGFADTCARRWDGACPPDPGAEKLYARHLRDLVAHARGQLTYYESWNEPDQPVFFQPRPSPERYAALLKLQYRVIKRANPRAQVLFAATGGTNLPFTGRVLRALDGAKVFDAVAVHPYRYAGPDAKTFVKLADGRFVQLTFKDELLAIASLFRRRGYGRLPMWITEFGWGAMGSRGGKGLFTLTQQAVFLQRSYKLIRDDPELDFVKSAFWFNLRDYAPDAIPNPDEEGFRHHGLETTDFERKPAAETYRRLAARGGKT